MTIAKCRPTMGMGVMLLILFPRALAAGEGPSGPPALPSSVKVGECQGVPWRDDPSCQPDWAIEQTGILKAQERIRVDKHAEPGEGVVIAHVDTGYSAHPLLPLDKLLLGRGWSLECDEPYDAKDVHGPEVCPDGTRDPHDRFAGASFPLARQPGHGTGTLSVLASPKRPLPSPNDGFFVAGVAPGASIVPYRATRGSELTENRAWHMARAIERAVLDPALPPVDVISMSFGRRSPYPLLKRAVELAESRGIIVVVAAGQFSISPDGGHVRFPGAHPSVVAVAGTTISARPWTGFGGTSQGREVDIAAPAVGVWRAETTHDGNGGTRYLLGRGSGTSFSTPLVAGTAALWVQWYGRACLEKTYGPSAIPAAFLYDLHHRGYRQPTELCALATAQNWASAPAICKDKSPWPEGRMGPGLLAADKLLGDPSTLPTREQVCQEVFDERGAEGLAAVCPCARDDVACQEHTREKLTRTLPRPAYIYDAKLSLVSAVTLGAPFGRGGEDAHWYSPSVSYGLIFSHHEFVQPRGLLVQVRGGVGGFAAGVGYASIVEYGPLRNGEDKHAVIPGFGAAAFGVGVKAGYLRAVRSNFVGAELMGSAYRVKLSVGYYRGVSGPEEGQGRLTFEYGVGF